MKQKDQCETKGNENSKVEFFLLLFFFFLPSMIALPVTYTSPSLGHRRIKSLK